MNIAAIVIFASMLCMPLVCRAEPVLKVISPNKKYQLVVEPMAPPDNPDDMMQGFAICDAEGKVIQKLGPTSFAVVAVKWHKSADSVMILLHIARQAEINLITKQNGTWKLIPVTQFKNPPNYFQLINAQSAETSFMCYYVGDDDPHKGFTAYRTEVNIVTGKESLKSTKRIETADLPFYTLSVGGMLYQMRNQSAKESPHFSSSIFDDEPEWFGIRD